jgi:hypothetical protein
MLVRSCFLCASADYLVFNSIVSNSRFQLSLAYLFSMSDMVSFLDLLVVHGVHYSTFPRAFLVLHCLAYSSRKKWS